jgi:hypothetical protein
MEDRREYTEDGALDEIVGSGGAHLERLSKKNWFLSITHADGSQSAVWFRGRIELFEVRPPRPTA